MTEWRTIPGYEVYEASSDGRVRRPGRRNGEPLTPAPVGDTGYLKVTLYVDGAAKTFRLNRLICTAFHGPPPFPGAVAAHLDNDKLNNSAANLTWTSQSENILHCVRSGNHSSARRTHCPSGHEYTAENTVTRPGRRGRECRSCVLDKARERRSRETAEARQVRLEYMRNYYNSRKAAS